MSSSRLFLEKIPFFALSAASSVLTYVVQRISGAVTPLEAFPLEIRVANALVSYVSYIKKLIWPSRLAVLYPHPGMWPLWQVAGAGVLLACMSALVIRAARKRPYLLVGWLWYLGTLVPVIGLVQVGSQALADRYTYVPLVGLFIMVAWGVPSLLGQWHQRRLALALSGVILLSMLTIITKGQLEHWRNDTRLYEQTLRVTTGNYIVHNNLAVVLLRQGKAQEAIAHFEEALRIKPNYAEAHYNLGVALGQQGKIEEAIAHYSEAVRIKPDYPEPHNHLAVVLFRQGKTQEAIAHLEEAVRIKPDYAEAHYNLGVALGQQGKTEEAIAHLEEAVRIKPDYVMAHNNLGFYLARRGKTAEALSHYSEALRIKPDLLEAHNNMGDVFFAQGKIQEAIFHYTQALQINPLLPEAHFSLGLAYLSLGNRELALEEFRILETKSPELAKALSQKIYK